jgi:Leucine-rich repeat (LRR) protein
LKKIPFTLFQLKKLENLYLNSNLIDEILLNETNNISSQTLNLVDLSENKLQNFPLEIIEKCESLNILRVAHNYEIKDISCLQNLKKIRK